MSDDFKTYTDYVVTLGKGNPGAMQVLADVYKTYPELCVFVYRALQDLEITGLRIWTIYKDECNKDIDDFVKTIFNLNLKEGGKSHVSR